ncbi:MAG: regulatory iron-sulfur-containing complex subunit RicT [Candidatus Brocadiia bacterium]|nr:regulatory iron-sulfur-containing complex subunit RicT [Candidatus Brocadiia bacterium]
MPRYAAVRYGAMDSVAYFDAPPEGLREGDGVIIRTDRGLEWGETVSQMRQRDDDAESRGPEMLGQIMRKATEKDSRRQEEIAGSLEKEEFQYCEKLIAQYELPMKLVKVEHLFGGNKMIFFFLAEGRVDFRALVKELAGRYRTRIEMRQIGVRDEARLLGRYGPCGRELCCRAFLKDLKPIPMKIAKSQKSTLDPAKISGRCGRLKCCLNFEDKLYAELKKALPRRGTTVTTPKGAGVVVAQEIIGQRLLVRLEDGSHQKFDVKDIDVEQGKERDAAKD